MEAFIRLKKGVMTLRVVAEWYWYMTVITEEQNNKIMEERQDMA